MTTGIITLTNGKIYEYNVDLTILKGPEEIQSFKKPHLFLKALKKIVFDNCEHDINTHHSFQNAKNQRCRKCNFLVPKNNL